MRSAGATDPATNPAQQPQANAVPGRFRVPRRLPPGNCAATGISDRPVTIVGTRLKRTAVPRLELLEGFLGQTGLILPAPP